MAYHGLAEPQPQPPNSKSSSDGLSHNTITVESLACIPELMHAPRAHRLELEDLYKRAGLDVEELIVKQAVVVQKLAVGEYASPTTAAIAVERVIPLCQTAHSMLLSVALGCNAILSAFRPWDISLIEDRARYCGDVILLAKEVAPYRPLGASHFPLCLIAAYLTAIEPAEIKELRDLLMEFQKDFASSSWLTMAMKARNSYWAARTAYANDSARETDTEAEKTFEGDDKSFCAVQ
jgi:hypothetical protein